MRKAILIFVILSAVTGNLFSQNFSIIKFTGNNVCSYFTDDGTFNRYYETGYSMPGLEWICGTHNYFVFTTGINLGCYIDGRLAIVNASYTGEFSPGIIKNLKLVTGSDFKLYRVRGNDNNTNPDYENWYKMVPYGAPYDDLNHNCIFDIGIDKPGMKDANVTIFICLTDADSNSRHIGNGFGGGLTNPLLMADIRVTAWAYINPTLEDVQFMKFKIINQNTKRWDSVYFAVFNDPDVMENPNDDRIGCDTIRHLGYSYNTPANEPGVYGMMFLRGLVNRNTNDTLMMTSYNWSRLHNSACEWEATGEPYAAFNYMRGYKKDGTAYLDPTYFPPRKTKFIFYGDPETQQGWTYDKGYIYNCGGSDTGTVYPAGIADAKFHMGCGAGNLNILPGDTQVIVMAQLLASGTSNVKSVTNLKKLADRVNTIYATIKNIVENDYCQQVGVVVPKEFWLSENFPNPFNSITNIRYNIPRYSNIKITLFDMRGREVAVVLNSEVMPGSYTFTYDARSLSSGVYFMKINVTDLESNSLKEITAVRKIVLVK